jgi:hypothetical protein
MKSKSIRVCFNKICKINNHHYHIKLFDNRAQTLQLNLSMLKYKHLDLSLEVFENVQFSFLVTNMPNFVDPQVFDLIPIIA